MPGLMPGIHVFLCGKEGVGGRDIGERSDAVLRTPMPGHDEGKSNTRLPSGLEVGSSRIEQPCAATYTSHVRGPMQTPSPQQAAADRVYVAAEAAEAFVRALLLAHNVPEADAKTIAGCLV